MTDPAPTGAPGPANPPARQEAQASRPAAGGRAAAVTTAAPDSAAVREQIEAVIAERRRQRSRRERRVYLTIRLVSLAVVLAAWQWYGMNSIAIIFDPITRVVAAVVDMARSGGLGDAVVYSLWTFALGYLAGLVAGVVIGMCVGAYRKAESAIGLYLYALYATPMVAIVPLLSIWLGFGVVTQELIIALFVLFPIVVTVSAGVRNLDRDLLEVARSLRMSRANLWRHVLLPGTVPFIAAGAAQGVAMGLVGMFIAEIFTQLTGLGNLLETAAQTYHTDRALGVVLVIMALGVTLRGLITIVQRKVAPWAK